MTWCAWAAYDERICVYPTGKNDLPMSSWQDNSNTLCWWWKCESLHHTTWPVNTCQSVSSSTQTLWKYIFYLFHFIIIITHGHLITDRQSRLSTPTVGVKMFTILRTTWAVSVHMLMKQKNRNCQWCETYMNSNARSWSATYCYDNNKNIKQHLLLVHFLVLK